MHRMPVSASYKDLLVFQSLHLFVLNRKLNIGAGCSVESAFTLNTKRYRQLGLRTIIQGTKLYTTSSATSKSCQCEQYGVDGQRLKQRRRFTRWNRHGNRRRRAAGGAERKGALPAARSLGRQPGPPDWSRCHFRLAYEAFK